MHQNVKCYDCDKMGHCANHCPNPTGVSNANANGNSNDNNDDANQNSNDNGDNNDTNNNNDNDNDNNDNDNDNDNNDDTQQRSGTNIVTIRGWNCFQKKREQLQGVALAALDEKLRKWSLLDNCSTDDIFCNEDHLEDIHEVDTTLDLKSNGGGLSTKWVGTYPGFGEVWCDPRQLQTLSPKI